MEPDIRLVLAARAENIAIVRHALGGLGEAFTVPEKKLADVRLAVTEACSNVVVHAYPDGHEGPMEVSATMRDGQLTVLVRDWGCGIRPRSDSPGLGLGLPLIAAVAEQVQLGHDEEEHTEVRMTFVLTDGAPSINISRIGASSSADTTSDISTRPDVNNSLDMSAQPDISSSLGTNTPSGMNILPRTSAKSDLSREHP